MNSAELINKLFLNLERDKDLFGLKIKNISVWNYLRHPILQDLYDDLLSYNINTVKLSSSNKLLFKIKHIILFINRYLIPFLSYKPINFNQFDFKLGCLVTTIYFKFILIYKTYNDMFNRIDFI